MEERPVNCDVIVVGAGPNGLMLASELRLSGLRPVVLERLPERSMLTRAEALTGRVVKLLDYRGVYQRITGTPEPPAPVPAFYWAGFSLNLADVQPHSLYVAQVPQPVFETILEERARELGVEIRFGHELVDVSQDADQAVARVRGPEGEYDLAAAYLVGCDGASSQVRKRAGIGFPSTGDQDLVARTADVVLDPSVLGRDSGPSGLRFDDSALRFQESALEVPGLGRVPFGFTRTARGVFIIGAFVPGVHIVGTLEWGRDAVDTSVPMSVEELRESVARVLGADVPMTAPAVPGMHRLYRLTGDSRQAERYREGRVLLVGDAAHVHQAFGGPGLNLGLQDAVNLGWKLAGAVQGWAPDGLLDTYEVERRPVGERVLLQTQAQAALFAPGTDVTAMRGVLGELLAEPPALRRLVDLMAGADVRYPWADADVAEGEQPHALTGRWVPDTALLGGGRVGELLRAGRPVLLDFAAAPELAKLAGRWADRVDYHAVAAAQEAPADALLVRPDGYVAWAGDVPEAGADGDGTDAASVGPGPLERALVRWFGAAS
jgi:2-polyprenyl-6-methoxyphenol hydroxylase-like FAD-dependent oxidoreductase